MSAQYPAGVLHLHQEIASASAGKASEHVLMAHCFNDTLPSGGLARGLAACRWRSGNDFRAHGVSTAENFDAMTSFFETYCI